MKFYSVNLVKYINAAETEMNPRLNESSDWSYLLGGSSQSSRADGGSKTFEGRRVYLINL